MAVSEYLRDAMRCFSEDSGRISAEALRGILSRGESGAGGMRPEDVNEVVSSFAKDGGDEIDVEEFLTAMSSSEPAASELSEATKQRDAGFVREACELFRQVVATRRRELGDAHPSTVCALEHLGMALYMVTDLDAAARCLREVVDARCKKHGEGHPSTVAAMAGLGCLLKDSQDFAAAEALLRKAAKAFEGDFTEKAITSRGMLASLYKDMGDLERARHMLQAHRREIVTYLGETHTSYVTATTNLGEVLLRKGDYAGAEGLLRAAVKASRGLDDKAGRFMCTQTALGNLAHCLEAQGATRQIDEAIELLTEVVDGFAAIEHPMTQAFRAALQRLLKTSGHDGNHAVQTRSHAPTA